jgi:hypothetical protein
MQISRQVKNIVLLGNFQAVIPNLDKYFFIKNGIISENEIMGNSYFDTIGGVQMVSNKFYIIIASNQMAITASKPENDDDGIEKILALILDKAGISKVDGMGINFHFLGADDTTSIEELSKKHFFSDKIDLLTKFFSASDARFGTYASTDFKNARLKLDIKPSIVQNKLEPTEKNVMNFAFNFHFDIKNKEDNSEVLGHLKDYDVYKDEAQKIISYYK